MAQNRMLFGCYRKQLGMDMGFNIICLCELNVHHLQKRSFNTPSQLTQAKLWLLFSKTSLGYSTIIFLGPNTNKA